MLFYIARLSTHLLNYKSLELFKFKWPTIICLVMHACLLFLSNKMSFNELSIRTAQQRSMLKRIRKQNENSISVFFHLIRWKLFSNAIKRFTLSWLRVIHHVFLPFSCFIFVFSITTRTSFMFFITTRTHAWHHKII